MTRKEQIKEIAQKEMSKYPNFCITAPAFRMGAEWADAHPDIDVRTMAAWQSGYKEAIEKACEWLYEYNRKQSDKMFGTVHTADVTINVAQFRKDMKGGEK